MVRIERDDNPYLPLQVTDSQVDVPSTNEFAPAQSDFCLPFMVFSVACNLMMGMPVFGSLGDGRRAFGFQSLVIYGTPVLNLALVLAGLLALIVVRLGKKSLDWKRALRCIFLTTFLCYFTVMFVYFYLGGKTM